MPRTKTKDDGRFCDDVATIIIQDWLLIPNHGTEFTAWARTNKKLLISLFSGQGINRLARVVAWARREFKGRRSPPEVLCLLTDLYKSGAMVSEEPVLLEAWPNPEAMLRSVLLDDLVAAVLLRPATGAELDVMSRTALMVTLGL